MKTKIFGGIAIVVIALAVAFNVSLNTGKTNNASLLALANVEALADGENGTGARSCSLSWKVTVFGVSVDKSCSVTCDQGFNAKCELKKCECVKA